MAENKRLALGMYDCVFTGKLKGTTKGAEAEYHSSTAQTLWDKGLIEEPKKVKSPEPKGITK